MNKVSLGLLFTLVCAFSSTLFAAKISFDAVSLTADETISKTWENDSLSISFQISEMDVNVKKIAPYKDDFQQIQMNGLNVSKKVGAPELPFYSMIVEGRPEEIKLNVELGDTFQYDFLPVPAQEKPCRCAKKNELSKFHVNKKFYNKGQKQVELVHLGDFKGRELTKVIVRPVSYNFKEGLRVYPNMKVKLNNITTFSMASIESNETMLVLYTDSLEDGANEFINYKKSQGFNIISHALSEVGKTADDVKSFVQSQYGEQAFDYAVFVGHEDNFPSHYVQTSSSTVTPSDYPNFLMGGEGDQIPDVFYGRIVAQTNAEVHSQVTKMIEYNSKSWDSAEGEKNHIGIASNEGWDPTDVQYVQAMINPLVSALGHEASYFLQENSDATVENINESLNRGAIFLNYIGHGSGNSWSSIAEGEYHSDDVKNLKAGKVKPIIIDVACQNGRFNYNGRLGERFMNETSNGKPIGAVAYYGGSVDISWDPPAVMAIAINEAIAKQNNESLAQVIMKGQMHLIETYDDPEAAIENLKWYHIFGDPALATPAI
ncbi:C25 family cysteine peptidase [Bacteriovoracaceae bacterium]|nr:C25 family cysteine peptidase [Bacteriovoracaceae bacterium]